MKFPVVVTSALALCAVASADRVINVPVGRKIAFGAAKVEYRTLYDGSRTDRYGATFGVTNFFEADVYGISPEGESTEGSFDVMFNLVRPVADFSPGISFGVQDALNVTDEGRRGYGVISYRVTLSTIDSDQPAEVSLGFYMGARTAPFLGLTMPLASFMGIVLEHDTYEPAAALDFKPIKDLNLRIGVRGGDTLLGASYLIRF